MSFLNKAYIRGRACYITPVIRVVSAAQVLAHLMFTQHILSLSVVQRKEVAFRWLQQLHTGTQLVPVSKLVLGQPRSASCIHGFLPEELQTGSPTPYFLLWWLEEESLNAINLLLEGLKKGRFRQVMVGQKKRKQSVGEKRLEKVKYFM